MPGYSGIVTTQLDATDTFGLLADFSNADQWDPATVAAKRIGGADGTGDGRGARYELTMSIAGRKNSIVYEVVEFEAPRRIVLRGENSGSVSIDEISVKPALNGHGSVVTYNADVKLKGVYKLITPLFSLVFKRMGDGARESMHDWLDERAAAARFSGDD